MLQGWFPTPSPEQSSYLDHLFIGTIEAWSTRYNFLSFKEIGGVVCVNMLFNWPKLIGSSNPPISAYWTATSTEERKILASILFSRKEITHRMRISFMNKWEPDNQWLTGNSCMPNYNCISSLVVSCGANRHTRYAPSVAGQWCNMPLIPVLEAEAGWSSLTDNLA